MKKENTLDHLLDALDPNEIRKVELRMAMAARIDEAMKKRHISKLQLAKLTGKNPSMITKWLSGGHNFTLNTLSDIGHALDTTLVDVSVMADKAVAPPIRIKNEAGNKNKKSPWQPSYMIKPTATHFDLNQPIA